MKRALLLMLASASAFAGVSKGQRAPDFKLPTLAGAQVSLSALRGKVVVLDFWAQWCEPCKQELPELQRLYKAYESRNVVVIGVNLDKQRDNAEKLAQKLGLTFPIALDPSGGVAGAYDLPKMPTSFVIDQKGLVRFVHEGFDGPKDIERFQKELDSLTR